MHTPHGPPEGTGHAPHLQAPGSGSGTGGRPRSAPVLPWPLCTGWGVTGRGREVGGPRAAVAGSWELWRFGANVRAALAAFPPGGHLPGASRADFVGQMLKLGARFP